MVIKEGYNRYDNDVKHKKVKIDRIKHPTSKGSIRSKQKQNLRNLVDNIDDYDDYDIEEV